MLDGFRKRDVSRPPNPIADSAYSRLNQALGAAAPADVAKPPIANPEPPKAQEPPKAAKAGDKVACKLTVGPDIKLKGAEITDCDTLVVEGRVEASMNSRVIQISESGVFVGKVGIEVAEIRGQFEGELTAHTQLVIHTSGRVSGKIRYGTISIEEGGELSGDVATIASGMARAPATDQNRTLPAPPSTSPVPGSQALTGTAGMRGAPGR
ncbi:MAG: polymer-forming cytoskeletal protein [Burkholderiales bacterium]|nr:polymer-forming cytoskeletal protein [Burkholderiales bacterium]